MSQAQPCNRRAWGSAGEQVAADHLRSQGYQIIHQNWRCRYGEIDIIALDPEGTTAFVEVKQARGTKFGTPESWVRPRKQRQLYRLAQVYLQQNKIYKINARFDVIGIAQGPGTQDVRHIKNAFMAM